MRGAKQITVPFSYETKASGIGNESHATKIRYSRSFEVKKLDCSILLHFAGVDYRCEVWINGIYAGGHVGCYTAFCLDITNQVKLGENEVVVVVYDSLSKAQLRGKQRAREEFYECWYVQTTGIWKDVWLEYAGKSYIEALEITPHNDGVIDFSIQTCKPNQEVEVIVSLNGEIVSTVKGCSNNCIATPTVTIPEPILWSVENPCLYSVKLISEDDIVHSYFGLREVKTDDGIVNINGDDVYLRMVLEQGYWVETGLTAPSPEALWKEVELIKSLGFNGVRMHQKVESTLFYYFCDLLGLYVWGELPSNYEYSDEAKAEMRRDCPLIIKQLRPHPSIIAWVVFNESWGIPHVKNDGNTHRYVKEICDIVRTVGGQRLVISNDGWHQLDGDLLTLHEYNQDAKDFAVKYKRKEEVVGNKLIINTFGFAYAEGYHYNGQPVLISEFGGIAINEADGWGYGDKAENKDGFCKRLAELFDTIYGLDYLAGYCYTQITDVQQEVNGLCYADRTPKVAPEIIRNIIRGK